MLNPGQGVQKLHHVLSAWLAVSVGRYHRRAGRSGDHRQALERASWFSEEIHDHAVLAGLGVLVHDERHHIVLRQVAQYFVQGIDFWDHVQTGLVKSSKSESFYEFIHKMPSQHMKPSLKLLKMKHARYRSEFPVAKMTSQKKNTFPIFSGFQNVLISHDS